MKWMVGSILFFLLTLPFPYSAFCGGVSVEGVVEDQNQRRIANCSLSIGNNRARTDAYGNFAILVEPGEYPIQVQGYRIGRVDAPYIREGQILRVLPRSPQRIRIVVHQ
jgi:hypothetical protein